MVHIDEHLPAPAIVDRDAWLREREALLAREKAPPPAIIHRPLRRGKARP